MISEHPQRNCNCFGDFSRPGLFLSSERASGGAFEFHSGKYNQLYSFYLDRSAKSLSPPPERVKNYEVRENLTDLVLCYRLGAREVRSEKPNLNLQQTVLWRGGVHRSLLQTAEWIS